MSFKEITKFKKEYQNRINNIFSFFENNRKLNTYGFSRAFYGLNIPIPIQTVYLRDYAQRNKFEFSLPVTEISSVGSYYSLSNVFNDMKEGGNFGAISILVLPLFNKLMMSELFNLIKFDDVIFHFPLEGFVGDKNEILKWKDNFKLFNAYKKNLKNKPFF